MGNLYVFGCSFSFGSHIFQIGKATNGIFYQDQFHEYWWGHQVARYLNMNVHNYAVGGGSNDTVMYRAIRESINLCEDDVVMLGRTQGDRVSLEAYRHHLYPGGGTDLNRGITNAISNDDIQPEFKKELKRQLSDLMKPASDEELDLLVANHLLWYAPDDRAEIYSKFYEKQFQWLGNLLSRTGAKVITWDYTIWNKFETITEWLRNRATVGQRWKDSHWSPNGNTGFAAFVIDAIQRDEFFINEFHVKTRKEEIYSKYLHELLPHVDGNFKLKV